MWIFAEVETSTALFLTGLVLMIGVFLLRSQRQVLRATRSFPRQAAAPVDPAPLRGRGLNAPADYERWEVEMHDVARELTARLDTKIALLEQLLRAADEQGARLTAVVQQASLCAASDSPPFAAEGQKSPTSYPQLSRPLAQVGRHVATQAAALAAVGTAHHYSPAPQEQYESPSRPYAQIAALAEAGQSPEAIARGVGTPVGEVELILSLQRQQLSSNRPAGDDDH